MRVYITKVKHFKYEVISDLRGHLGHLEASASSSCFKPFRKGSIS